MYIDLICNAEPKSYEELKVLLSEEGITLPLLLTDQLQSATEVGFNAWMEGFCQRDEYEAVQNDILASHRPADPDDAAWGAAQGIDTPEAYQGYLDAFPVGRHSDEAFRRLIEKSLSEVTSSRLRAFQDMGGPVENPPMDESELPPGDLAFNEKERIILEQFANLGFEQPSFQCLGDYYRCKFSGIGWLTCVSYTAACLAERIIPMAGK